MSIRDGFNKVLKKAGQILMVSLVLSVGVGIGSLLTQYQLKLPLDFGLAGAEMVIFGVIMAFGGIVFALFSRH
jgi:hypothetical protein